MNTLIFVMRNKNICPQVNKCYERCMELPALLGNYERSTDLGAFREVTLSISDISGKQNLPWTVRTVVVDGEAALAATTIRVVLLVLLQL